MTIIVFLIDTSASMNQRTYIGARPTLLDIAKGAVESFVKLRQRNPESRFDRYMLFTSEESPNNIKAGWKENLATFMNELKNIKATGLSTIGSAVKSIFDVLNINRMQSGIDTYGAGRSPFFLEPSVIICISDGGKLSSSQGVQEDIFPLPKSNPIPGADLTSEIFRWDQRLFGLVLRLTGTPTPETMGLVPSDNSPLDELCEQTGGRTYAVRTHRMFQQCIESLVQKVQSGVVINFEKIGPDPPPVTDGKEASDVGDIDKENQQANPESQVNQMMSNATSNGPGGMLGAGSNPGWNGNSLNSTYVSQCLPGSLVPLNSTTSNSGNGNVPTVPPNSWYTSRKMIYVPRPTHRANHGCFWPIPESYWPDSSILSLPARSAHPNLKFTCTSQEPMVIDNLPFDKYELEPSPLTQFILSRKQPTICWQVFIANSSKNSDVGHPFGYLKASTTKPCVNLFVMPYNYPVLLPLLDDLFKTHRLKPNKEWRQQFDNYLRTMPPYYASPLKRALERMGVSNVFPDKFDSSLSYIVMNQLKKLKNQAKVEYEKICGEVEKVNQSLNSNMQIAAVAHTVTASSTQHEGIKVKPRKHLSRNLTSNHLLKEKLSHLRDQVTDYKNFTIAVRGAEIQPQMYRNPFDIARSQLIDQIARMRANFLQQSLGNLLTDKDQDQLHCKPISQMGNYQDYLKKMNPPLREIESAPVRQHMFGNPFKIDKRMSMMVDEADVDLMGAGGGGPRGNKRPPVDPLLGSAMRPNKRRKGPVPADFTLQHLVSSTSSSPASSPRVSVDEPHFPIPLSPISPISPASPQSFPPYQSPPPSPLIHLQDTPPTSPFVRTEPPSASVPSAPSLVPSPAVITPGYLQQVSPPGSPAAPPYPREDIPINSSHPVINGEVENSSGHSKVLKADRDSGVSEDIDDSESEDDGENELVMDESYLDDSLSQPPAGIPPSVGLEGELRSPQNGVISPCITPQAPYVINSRVSSLDLGNEDAVVNQGAVDTLQTDLYNKNLLRLCYKDVKRPGREFSPLFEKLQSVQGSTQSKIRFVKDVIHEALRFKRHALMGLLTQCMDQLRNGGSSAALLSNTLRTRHNLPRPIVLNGHGR